MNTLEEKLKSVKPAGTPPADLHSSIINAVRAAVETPAPRAWQSPPRWLLAAGVAAGVTLGAWAMGLLTVSRHGTARSLASAEPALAAGQKLAREVPAAMLSPMSDELAAVDRDFRNAVQHLLASVP